MTTNQSFTKVNIAGGINLYLYPTDMFKAIHLSLYIHRPLDENVTANSLLSSVLARGCRKYPNMRKISIFLDSLYGAGFSTDVSKIGERHILSLHFNGLADRFLPKKIHTLERGLEFLKRIIAEPLIRSNGLDPDYVRQEKQVLSNEINGLADNKIAYARQRCIETMCESEAYRIYDEGRVEDIPSLTPQKLLEHLQYIVRKSPIDVFVVGHFNPDRIEKSVRRTFNFKRDLPLNQIPPTLVNKPVEKERVIKEKTADMEQGKLVLGYRTYTSWPDEDVFPLSVFTGVLGAYPHSKLFQNVREKAGLAYYASSSLEKTKGLMMVQAGINPANFDSCVKIIAEQINEIKNGNISDEELSSTFKSIDDRLKTLRDNPSAFIGYMLELFINGRSDTVEEIRRKTQSVTKSDIIRVAGKVKLDTAYLLSV